MGTAFITPTSPHPLLTALRERARGIRDIESDKALRRLGPLAAEQGRAVDELLSAIVDRLLDAPRAAIEQLAREGRVDSCATAVRSVLGLG